MSPANNANEEYDRARKRALKEFALRRARGESGLLPVLNARREENGVLAVVDQPMRRISLNRIIGTYQASRANSFAHNFMHCSARTRSLRIMDQPLRSALQSGIATDPRV
jgi:hypothetical protein